MKKGNWIIAFAIIAACAWAQEPQPESHRGFYLDVGAGGFSYMTYGSAADSTLSSYASAQSADRLKVYLDLGIGWAVGPRMYVVGHVDGFGDGFFSGSTALDQINSYLYAIGIRYYPFVTGLVLGVDVGVSRLAVTSNASGVGSTPLSGGAGFTLAWDFGGAPTGWTAEIGARALYLAVSDPVISNVIAVTPFLNLVIK